MKANLAKALRRAADQFYAAAQTLADLVEHAQLEPPPAPAPAPANAVNDDLMTIREFCQANKVSQSFYYLMRKRGEGPREIRLGGNIAGKVMISRKAAAKWRKQHER